MNPRRAVTPVGATTAVLALLLIVCASILPAGPAAAAIQAAQITIGPATQTQLTGSPQAYNINIACLGTEGAQCGPDSTITIPLDPTTTPPMTAPTWTYSATAGATGLLLGQPTVNGDNLIIHLNDSFLVGGNSGSIRLLATPPNNVTPDHTTWTMEPTLTGDNIDPTPAPTPAASTATATPLPVVTKVTADGGSVFTAGAAVGYNITASCSSASTGNLYLTSGQLVDHLPAGMVYQSSTNGGVFDAVANTVTWTFPDAASTPVGCAAGSTGPNTFGVVALAPTPAPVVEPLTNSAAFAGTGPDASNPAGITRSANAQVPIQIVNNPATGPGQPGYATITKTSLAPLVQPGVSGNEYIGTYPGNWLPTGSAPSYTVGAAAGSFRATVNYAQVNTYQTEVVDPLPCLDDVSGNTYSSAAYNGAACAHPAFHPTIIQVASAGFDPPVNGLGAAVAAGWRPSVSLSNGALVPLVPNGSVGTSASSAYFTIPTADLALVASIELPPNAALMNSTLQLTMWGYADASLALVNGSLNELVNTATAVPELVPGTPLVPVQASADLFTVPAEEQLGISKAFGPTGAAPGGTTAVNIVGGINLPVVPLPQNIVFTDLLPSGMRWANPVSTASVALKEGGVSKGNVTAVITDLPNYQDSGRELVRVTIPNTAIASAGSWTLTPPINFLDVTTPTALGVYANTDQLFLFGLGSTQINANCTTPTQTGGGTSPATFENSNPQDLAGDGNLSEDYCQNAASLLISGTGAAFSLTKTVQGNLDSVPRGGLGMGNASNGGSGTYALTWSNVGSDNLDDAVIYDILPHIGDTGVSQGQAGNPRGSQFAPTLSSIGTLPAGVSVEYSESSNPCRPEVYPDAANPTCVNDWSSVPPANLATVLSLRFFSSSTHVAGTGFSVSVTVDVPPGVVNQVAWNSAATNAVDVSDPGNSLLATEPPKVGLVSPSSPSLVTQTSAMAVPAYDDLSDQVVITGTGGAPGTLAWTLLGPVAPVAGSCSAIDWTGVPVAQSGTVPVTGDGTVTTGPTTVGGTGCYSWADAIVGTSYAYSGTSPPGTAGEITSASQFSPALATVASATLAGAVQSASDAITVSGMPSAAPPTTLTWSLFGPLSPVAGSCGGLDWTTGPVVTTGSLPVPGDGTVTTPAVALVASGCYSFGDELPATADSVAAALAPGDPSEILYAVPPSLTSQSPVLQGQPNEAVSDSVTITGTSGDPGQLAWTLVGPVDPVDGSCTDVVWTGAPTVATGLVATVGDETVTTGPATLGAAGCYSWVDTLTATAPNSFPSPSDLPAGSANEVVHVQNYQPTLSTAASSSANPSGSLAVFDTVSIADTGLAGSAQDAPAVLSWELVGPVPPESAGCAGVSWATAAVVARGTIPVSGDGDIVTPSTVVAASGCYSFEEVLAATAIDDSASSTAGSTGETVLLPALTAGGLSAGGTGKPGTAGFSPVRIASLAFTGVNLILLLCVGGAMVVLGIAFRIRRRRVA
jgi:hypothetical protein